MKRHWKIAIAALLVILAVALFIYLLPKEPVYQGRPISEWIEQLTGGIGSIAGAVSSHPLANLVEQKPGEEIVPYLRATLHRGTSVKDRIYSRIYFHLPAFLLRRLPRPNPARDAELRYRAALILYYVGPSARKALPDLMSALTDPDVEVRRVSASVLGSFGTSAQRAAPGLIAALRDQSPDVRRAALKALVEVETDPVAAVPVVARTLKDSDEGVRTDAAQILKDLGPNARAAVRELTAALSDPNEDVFRFSAMALGKIGPPAKEAIPALSRALHDQRPYSETTIRWALKQIDPQALSKEVSTDR